jgi:predicted metal-dependent hydrolase
MLEFPEGVDLVPHARARRLALRVDPAKRRIRLVYPPRTPQSVLWKFANQNADWINRQLSLLPPPSEYAHGIDIPVFGQMRMLNINYDKAFKTTAIHLADNDIFVTTNQPDPSLRIRRFLNNTLLEALTTLSNDKAARVGKTVAGIALRDSKTRWGSCAHDGKLNYSRRLVYAPLYVVDYVAAHEVAHLVHMDHSDNFWAVCEELSEDYAAGKRWLKSEGRDLHRYP